MILGQMMAVAGGADDTIARPSAPVFSVEPGSGDGDIVLTVSALPTSWGDLSAPEDGLGTAGVLEWWNQVDGWQTLADPAATGTSNLTLSPLLWGLPAVIRVRGVSAAGREGVAATASDSGILNTIEPTMTLVSGTAGKIGAVYSIDPGAWSGSPAITRSVYRNAVEIPGTEGATTYTLAPADDLSSIFVRETASVGGVDVLSVDSAPIAVTYAAPVAVGTIADVNVVQGTGITTRDATAAFTGENITWSISGPADITIDEGIVFVPSSVVQAGVTATVHATNSGGTADLAFTVTVTEGTEPGEGPTPIDATEVQVTFEVDPGAGVVPGIPDGAATWMFKILSGPALAATRLWWHGNIADPAMVPGAGFHPTIPHPVTANKWIARAYTPGDLDTPRLRDWLWMNQGNDYDRVGQTVFETLIYTTDPLTTPVASATFSAFSDTLTQVANITTGEEEPPPPVSATAASRRMPLREEAEKNAGVPPGDGVQNWHATDWCLAQPDVIYGVQDTGGVWKSVNGGTVWRLPARTGLASFQLLGVAVDPVDPLRVLVNAGGSYPITTDYQGLYASTDGAVSFGDRIVAGVTDSRRGTHSAMAYSPGSIGAARAEKWLAIVDGRLESGTATNVPIMASTDGWGSWTQRGTWNQTTYGTSTWMAGDPSSDGRFYVAASKGLIRITNAFSGTLTFTNLSGANGLPAGGIGGKPYISADGQTIIVGVGGSGGIYKTTNGGGSWSQVGTHTEFSRLHINPYDPTRMISTTNEGSTVQTPAFTKNGGGSFTRVSQANVEKRRGYESSNVNMIGNFVSVCWHDSSPNRAFMHGRETSFGVSNNMYVTTDLVNWSLANEGFCGVNVGIRGQAPNLFDPADHLRFMLPIIDLGPRLTTDGGLSFTKQTLKGSSVSPAFNSLSTYGGAVHPSQDVVFCLTQDNPRLMRGTANASSWTEIAGVANGHHGIFADPDNDAVWFCGRKKSTNHGVSFATTMTDLPSDHSVCDRTNDGDAMWSHNYNGACDELYRSTNKGVAWALALTMGYNNKIPGSKWGPLACHPTNPAIIFTKHPTDGHKIRRWDVSSGTASTRPSTDLNVFGSGGSVPGDYTGDFIIYSLAIDPRDPDVMYAVTAISGDPRVYRTQDAGATAWEVLGADVIPLVCNIQSIAISPVTGDVMIGGSNGTFLIEPPYAQTSPPTLYSLATWGNYLAAGLPVNTSPPTATTTGVIGTGVTGNLGTWADDDSLAARHQYFDAVDQAWKDMPGETSTNLTALAAEFDLMEGSLLVTATNEAGSVSARSAPYAIKYAPPVISDAGSVTGTFAVGGTLTYSGPTVTGGGTSYSAVWTANGGPIAGVPPGNTFGPVPASLAGANVGIALTVNSSGGTATATVAGGVIAGSAPVAAGDQVWTEDEGTGTQTFDVKPFFTNADAYAITSGGTGVTITDGVLSIDAGPATASGGIGPVAAQAIVVEGSNGSGTDSLTVTLTVAERVLGTELVPVGAFATQSDVDAWGQANSPTVTFDDVNDEVLLERGASNNGQLRKSFATTIGDWYRVRVGKLENVDSGTIVVRIGTAGGSTAQGVITDAGYRDFQATTTAHWVTVNASGADPGDGGIVAAISVKPFSTDSLSAPTTANVSLASADALTGDRLTATVGAFPSGATGVEYAVGLGGLWNDSGLSSAGSFQVTTPFWEVITNVYFRWKTSGAPSASSDAIAGTPHFGSDAFFASPSGSDLATGTYTSPWRTFNKLCQTLTAGQWGYSRPGSYSPGQLGHSGTLGNEIVVTTLPGEEHLAIVSGSGVGAQIASGFNSVGKSHFKILNHRFDTIAGSGIGIFGDDGVTAQNITIQNNQIATTSNAGIYAAGKSMTPGNTTPQGEWKLQDIWILDNDLTNTNDPTGTNECVSVGNGCDGFEIARNNVHDSQQYGIDIKLGARNGSIHDNTVSGMEKHGIYVDSAAREIENVDIYGNKVHDCDTNGITLTREAARGVLVTRNSSGVVTAITVHGHYQNIDNVRIWNNEIARCRRGILIYKHPNDADDITEMFVDNATATGFGLGKRLLGGTSGARRTIVGVYPLTATTFRLFLQNVPEQAEFTGTADNGTAYQDNETVTCVGGSAQVNGTPTTGFANGISNVTVVQCTFIDAQDVNPGGMGYEFASSIAPAISNFTFGNCIIHGNPDSNINGFTSTPGYASAGLVTSDPTFANRAASPPDLTITGASSAAGAGNAAYDPLSAVGTFQGGGAVPNTDINGVAYANPPSAGAREAA